MWRRWQQSHDREEGRVVAKKNIKSLKVEAKSEILKVLVQDADLESMLVPGFDTNV